MLYKIGTAREIPRLYSKLPESVLEKLFFCTVTLDDAYGADRDYFCTGGYSVIAENEDDLNAVKGVVDFETHPCEWADRIKANQDYLSALYLLSDDYSIVLFMPVSIAPTVLLNEIND